MVNASFVLCECPADGKVLCVGRRYDNERIGGLPGGKCDPEEPFVDAARREFFEETGLHLASIQESPIYCDAWEDTIVQVYRAELSSEDWEKCTSDFAGPEGQLVRKVLPSQLMDSSQCEFASFCTKLFNSL